MKKYMSIATLLLSFTASFLHAMEPAKTEGEGDDNIVWLGCKFSNYNLDTRNVDLLEIAATITDRQLNIVAESPVYPIKIQLASTAANLENMPAALKEEYTKSGLLERIKASQCHSGQVEEALISFIKRHCSAKKPYCYIKSIAENFFLQRLMKKLTQETLEFQSLDYFSLDDFVELFDQKDTVYKYPVTSDAKEQARATMQHLAHYKKKFFTPRTKEHLD